MFIENCISVENPPTIYKFICSWCNATYYGQTERHLPVQASEDLGIISLTQRRVKNSKKSTIMHHILLEGIIRWLFDSFPKAISLNYTLRSNYWLKEINWNWTRTHNHLVHKPTLNHLAKLASLSKWLSVRLWTKWLWVRVQLQSLKL